MICRELSGRLLEHLAGEYIFPSAWLPVLRKKNHQVEKTRKRNHHLQKTAFVEVPTPKKLGKKPRVLRKKNQIGENIYPCITGSRTRVPNL